MIFDVESVGLHGDAYAVGFVVVDHDFQKVTEACFACSPDLCRGDAVSRKWVAENASEFLNDRDLSLMRGPDLVRMHFWAHWIGWKNKGYLLAADCPWPVEARFLLECVRDDYRMREWEGPYPLIDISSILWENGINPAANYTRESDELPAHNPLCDARQSARLLREIMCRR